MSGCVWMNEWGEGVRNTEILLFIAQDNMKYYSRILQHRMAPYACSDLLYHKHFVILSC